MKFKTLPTIVDAIEAREAIRMSRSDWGKLPRWLQEAHTIGAVIFTPRSVFLQAPDGVTEARAVDWIVRTPEGAIRPCRPEVFEKTHEGIDQ
jgi:hypothetical protein